MRIALISPYNPRGQRPGAFLEPPLGLYRLQSYLRRHLPTVECEVLDFNLGDLPADLGGYDLIGSSLLHATRDATLARHRELLARSPGAVSVCGGMEVSADTVDELFAAAPFLDLAVLGMGEAPLRAICAAAGRPERAGLAGIAWREGGRTRINFATPVSQAAFEDYARIDFASIPFERYWAYNNRRYTPQELALMRTEHARATVRLSTSSHCTLGCRFCSITHHYDGVCACRQQVRHLNPETIAAQIHAVRAAHPEVRGVFFADDNFVSSRRKLLGLCALIRDDPGLRALSYVCLARPDMMKPAYLTAMAAANFRMVVYGVEAFVDAVVMDMKKAHHTGYAAQARAIVLATLDAGIVPFFHIILFWPSADLDAVETTIEQSMDLIEAGARIGINPLVEVIAGAEIAAQRDAYEIERGDDGQEYVLPDDPACRRIARAVLHDLDAVAADFDAAIGPARDRLVPLHTLRIFHAVLKLAGHLSARPLDLAHRLAETKSEGPGRGHLH